MNAEIIKARLEEINSHEMSEMKNEEYKKYMFYNGATKDIIEEAIRKEFKKPETVTELNNRLTPINIMKKVVDKLANVYVETPVRDVHDGNESDSQLLELYEDTLKINIMMKDANRMFRLFKKCMVEIFLNSQGKPALRVLPPHTYYTFTDNLVDPNKPTEVWKVLANDTDAEKQMFAVFTDTEHFLVNGKGVVFAPSPDNAELVNPFGTLPFAYIVDSQIALEPVPDDDLYSMSIAIPILLSDLSFGIKFQAWSLIWTVDYDGDVPSGPNSILHLHSTPDGKQPTVEQLKPTLEIEQTLRYIESTVSYLLSSRNLKTSDISGQLTVENAASGIAKAIDNAEVAEEKKLQQNFFLDLEEQIWSKISKNMIEPWRNTGKLKDDFNVEFSSAFTPSVTLREPKVTYSEAEQIEVSKKKIDYGFSTLKRELYVLYPDMTEDQVEDLIMQIKEDGLVKTQEAVNKVSEEMKREESEEETEEEMPMQGETMNE